MVGVFFSLVAVSCSPSSYVTVQAIQKPIRMTPTRTPFMPVENTAQFEIQKTEVVPMATMEPTPTPTSRNLEGMYNVSIESNFLNEWYRDQFKELEVRKCENPCTKEKIDELLNSHDIWVVVQPNEGRILYTHSGWDFSGPEFGEIFLRIYNSGKLKETLFCLENDLCYQVVDFVILDRENVGEQVHIDELFEKNEEDDFFILTCSKRVIPGLETPKLIIKMRKL
jgi:hypothetical protein